MRFLTWLAAVSIVTLGLKSVNATTAQEAKAPHLRVIVETDAGGDPDDEGSLVRFLLYSNEWDVEGIIADRPKTTNQGAPSGLELCRKILKAYGQCHPNLVKHKPDYPSYADLDKRLVAGYDDVNDGVDLIIRSLTADDPRPIWFANWGSNSGTTSSMQRALDRLKKDKPPREFAAILKKIHCTRNAEKLGSHAGGIAMFVDTRNPDRWYHRFEPLTAKAGGCDVKRDIESVGPLGSVYATPKEGDSLAFIYLIPTGLSDPLEPTWGGWGGRYSPLTKTAATSGGKQGVAPREGFYWAEAQDTLEGKTSRDNTLARWAAALQNDFRARMQWSVAADPAKANHEPVVVLQNDRTRQVLRADAPVGRSFELSAEGSSDPDKDAITYRWFVYPEPGTYRGDVKINNADSARATLEVPADAAGKTIHVVVEVTDSGKPALTRYRRIVLTGTGGAPPTTTVPAQGAGD